MNRAARRRKIERIAAAGDRLAAQMGGRFIVSRRKLREYVRTLAAPLQNGEA